MFLNAGLLLVIIHARTKKKKIIINLTKESKDRKYEKKEALRLRFFFFLLD